MFRLYMSRFRCLPRLLFTVTVGLSLGAVSDLAWCLGKTTDLSAVDPSPDDISHAAQQFDEGRDAFRSERYSEAAEAFEKADALAPNAKVLLLAIQSRELSGDLPRAATLAALAQQRHPGDPLFDGLNEMVRKADSSLARVTITCEQPCQLMMGSRLIHGPPATRRYVYLEPGTHRLRVSWGDENSAPQQIEAVAGKRPRLRFAPATKKADEPKDDWDDDTWTEPAAGTASGEGQSAADEWDDASWGEGSDYEDPPDDALGYTSGTAGQEASDGSGMSPAVFWTGAATTAILAGVSIWSGIDTLNNPGQQRVVEECGGWGVGCPTYQEGLRNQDRTNILWSVTAGVGVLTTLVGAFWTDWTDPDEPAKQAGGALSIRPVLSIGGMNGTGSGARSAGIEAPYVGAVGRF